MNSIRPYAQLIRLPNVFTAWADVWFGLWVTWYLQPSAQTAGLAWSGVCVLIASACFYCAGMVFNDVFDVEDDRRERPERPLPSGEISTGTAVRLGMILLLVAEGTGALAGWSERWENRPAATSICLGLAILLYDAWLKRTWAGPFGMGLCRWLNVFLGLACWRGPWESWAYQAAAAVAVYIIGVTWFARTEAGLSRRAPLTAGTFFMIAGFVIGLAFPWGQPKRFAALVWCVLIVGIGWIGSAVCQALGKPIPQLVQRAVKRGIFGLAVLDAGLTTAFVGVPGLAILLLLLPAVGLGRRLRST